MTELEGHKLHEGQIPCVQTHAAGTSAPWDCQSSNNSNPCMVAQSTLRVMRCLYSSAGDNRRDTGAYNVVRGLTCMRRTRLPTVRTQ